MNLAEMLMTGPIITKAPPAQQSTDRRNRAQTAKVQAEILRVLSHGETSTQNVARDLKITRPAALNLLTKMRKDGLVVARVVQEGITKKAYWSKADAAG